LSFALDNVARKEESYDKAQQDTDDGKEKIVSGHKGKLIGDYSELLWRGLDGDIASSTDAVFGSGYLSVSQLEPQLLS
jgi:hypothetical protein